jgi:zinc protease
VCSSDLDTLIASYNHELNKIAKEGIDPSYVEKVKKAWIEKYKVDMKRNEFWLSALQAIERGERTSDRLINAEKYYNTFSAEDLKKAAMLLQKATGKLMAVQMPE